MKNGLGEVQNIVLFGSSSEIGNAIVESIPQTSDSRITRIGVSSKSDVTLDLSRPLSIREFRAVLPSNDIDVAVFASGTMNPNPGISLSDTTLEMFNVNFNNTVLGISLLVEKMINQGHGTLVVISSIATANPRRTNFIYGATKAGLDFYVRGLISQTRNSNITILLIRPGFVFTKLTANHTPAPLAISPQKLASCISKNFFRKSKIVYTSNLLRFIYFILKSFPSSIVFKIK